MQQFLHYERLSDWDDERVVLVDIQHEHEAYVRVLTDRTYEGPMPVHTAIADANRKLGVGLEEVGVHVRDGAVWNVSWGKLKPAT